MNVTSITGQVIQESITAAYGAHTEISIFILAFTVHALFFRRMAIRSKPAPRMDLKKVSVPGGSQVVPAIPKPVSRCIHAKQLAKVADRFCEAKTEEELGAELSAKIKEVPAHDVLDAFAGLVEGAGKAVTPQLLAAVRGQLSERGLQPNLDLGELILRSYFGLRLFKEFDQFYDELVEAHGAVPSLGMLAMKAALRSGDLEKSLDRVATLQGLWNKGAMASPSAAPVAVLQQLVRLATQENEMTTLLTRLEKVDLLENVIDTVLIECLQIGDAANIDLVLKCIESNRLQFGEAAYGALIKNAKSPQEALRLFKDATIKLKQFSKPDVLSAAAEWALDNDSKELAEAVLQKLPTNPPAKAVGKILRFYSKSDSTKALQMYTKQFSHVDFSDDVETMHLIAQAASESDAGQKVLSRMLATATEQARVSLLKVFCKEKQLQAALNVLWASPDKGACLYNAAIDACVDCRSIDEARKIMAEAVKAGVADTITYNTIIKAYTQGKRPRDAQDAQRAFEEMKAAGLRPNSVTFNELLDAVVKNSIEDAWPVLDEMKTVGIKPNRITCAITLKAVHTHTKPADVERIMALVDEIEEDLDEVLLSSVVDACIRAGRAELLIPQLKRHKISGKANVKNAHTYASIIRAYSFVHDIEGVWEAWREMRARENMLPSAVTLGCMTEALVNNNDPEGAHAFIRGLLKENSQWSSCVNAVVYCSVLKGFSHQKRFDRMWAIYLEMLELKLQFSIVTFNTLLDACSRNAEMTRIPGLLSEMTAQNIPPNIITYGIVMKGWCQENKVENAFAVMQDMKENSNIVPDEVMFNTLLDGCARQGMYDRGMSVLKEMEDAEVMPTNFTLSVLVKLATRSKRMESAFDICRDLSAKYKFRLNVHVYNNLINACLACKDFERAMDTLEKMFGERVRPDTRTYSLLLHAFAQAGQGNDVAGLLRAALGVGKVHPRLSKFDSQKMQPQTILPSSLVTEMLEAVAGPQCQDERLAVALLKDMRGVRHLKLDPKLPFRLATGALKPGRDRAGTA